MCGCETREVTLCTFYATHRVDVYLTAQRDLRLTSGIGRGQGRNLRRFIGVEVLPFRKHFTLRSGVTVHGEHQVRTLAPDFFARHIPLPAPLSPVRTSLRNGNAHEALVMRLNTFIYSLITNDRSMNNLSIKVNEASSQIRSPFINVAVFKRKKGRQTERISDKKERSVERCEAVVMTGDGGGV